MEAPFEGDQGPETTAARYVDGWMDGWMDTELFKKVQRAYHEEPGT
jgi:hypothetical protein